MWMFVLPGYSQKSSSLLGVAKLIRCFQQVNDDTVCHVLIGIIASHYYAPAEKGHTIGSTNVQTDWIRLVKTRCWNSLYLL